MIRLLRFELSKVIYYKSFWTTLGLYSLVLFGIAKYSASSFLYISGFLSQVFLGYLVITLISNEFEHKILRQHIMNGLGRGEALVAKFLLFFVLILFSALFIFSLSFLFTETSDYSREWFTDAGLGIAQFSLRTLAYLSLALFVGLSFKKASSAIAIFFLWPFAFEPLLGWVLGKYVEGWSAWLPSEVFSRLLKSPMAEMMKLEPEATSSTYFATLYCATLAYIVLFWAISYFRFSRSDI